MEGLTPPPRPLAHEIIAAMTGIPRDDEHEGEPADHGEEEEGDEAATQVALGAGVLGGEAGGEGGGGGEFPRSRVQRAGGEGAGGGGGRAAAAAAPAEHVHVFVGHVDAAGDFFVAAGAGEGFGEGEAETVYFGEAGVGELARYGQVRGVVVMGLLGERVCSTERPCRTDQFFSNVCVWWCDALHAGNSNNASCATAHLFTDSLVAS